jgi:hypothetical protein
MLDLFAGQLGWAKAFLARGWKVTVVDLVRPAEIPEGAMFFPTNVLDWTADDLRMYDFVCASSPCEQFSLFGMKHFHPNPKHPEMGIKLFEHTRTICEESGVPYIMENVRAAQQFVGQAVHHCGPFYLWGNGVPPLLHKGIIKGTRITPGNTVQKALDNGDKERVREIRRQQQREFSKRAGGASKAPALSATIPPELANCVAEYAERIIEAEERLTG